MNGGAEAEVAAAWWRPIRRWRKELIQADAQNDLEGYFKGHL
jgi:hypothetical protein